MTSLCTFTLLLIGICGALDILATSSEVHTSANENQQTENCKDDVDDFLQRIKRLAPSLNEALRQEQGPPGSSDNTTENRAEDDIPWPAGEYAAMDEFAPVPDGNFTLMDVDVEEMTDEEFEETELELLLEGLAMDNLNGIDD